MKKFFHSFIEPQTVVLWLTYWMYLFIIPGFIAIFINYLKVLKYKKTCVNGELHAVENGNPSLLFASHHDWLVRSFIFLIIMSMVSIGTLYSGIGILLGGITLVVWIGSLIAGMISLAAHKPMPGYYC